MVSCFHPCLGRNAVAHRSRDFPGRQRLTSLDDLGGVPLSMLPEEFGKFLANETEKMGKVIKAAGISVK